VTRDIVVINGWTHLVANRVPLAIVCLTIAEYGLFDLRVLLPEGAALELEIIGHFDTFFHDALLNPLC
jgi:hypothetical protein